MLLQSAIILSQELSRWDGVSSTDILDIYERYHVSRVFVEGLVSLIEAGEEEAGATWLLKHHFECGGILQGPDIHRVYVSIPVLEHWQARLHLLQCIPFMPVKAGDRKLVEAFVRKGLTDENKFVRAWSYHGLYELAVLFPELQQETQSFFALALEDEVASVKARIRNILKKGF